MALEDTLATHTLALQENTEVLRQLLDRLQANTPVLGSPPEAPARRTRTRTATPVETQASEPPPPAEVRAEGGAPKLGESRIDVIGQNGNVGYEEIDPQPQAAAVTPPAPAAAPAEPVAAAPATASPSDLRAVKEAMLALAKSDGHNRRAMAIAKRYGAEKLGDLAESHYAAAIADAQEALANPEREAA
jgi:hypothetical protein